MNVFLFVINFHYVPKFGVSKIFNVLKEVSPRLHLLTYSKISNIVNYYYNLK